MMEDQVIDNFFQFREGDIIQILDDEENDWVDLEYILDKRKVAFLFATNQNYVSGCPTRVIRRKNTDFFD